MLEEAGPTMITRSSLVTASAAFAFGICIAFGGTLPAAANNEGFIYSDGIYKIINDPSSATPYYTYAFGISNSGTVVGDFYNNTGLHPYTYGGGLFNNIPDHFSGNAYYHAINEDGVIVGYATGASSSGYYGGFVYSGSNYVTLNDPNNAGGLGTVAFGINDAGLIVGDYYNGFHNVGFVYSGDFTDVAFPGSESTQARAINNSNQIVGNYSVGGNTHGFLYSAGSYTELDFPGAFGTIATGINDSGQIVGYFFDKNDSATFGFIYSNGNYISINGPIDPSGPIQYLFLSGINNSGDVVGYYQTAVAPTPTPLPEAKIWTMLVLGLAAVGAALRSRRKGDLDVFPAPPSPCP